MRTIGIGLILATTVLAAPAAWGQQGPGRGRGGFDGLMLLSQKSVQDELKLSEDQAKQVNEQADKQRESFDELRDLSREERQKRMTESREQNQKMVSTVLNEEQQKRFRQISLQLQGAQALTSPEVATVLDLSDEQKKSVEEIQTASREEMRAAFQGGEGDRDAMRKKLQEARQASNDKLKAVLTAEQQTKWQELLGEPFKGELRGPGGPGQGQRRRNRDGAAIDGRDAARTVLTADRQDGESKAEGDAKKDDSKPHQSAKQGDKPRKKHGQKHVGKPGQRPEQQARHHRGPHGPRAMHARHGRPGHRTTDDRQRGDARSEAWRMVARAMGHQERSRFFSHHAGSSRHGHPGFHGPRPDHGRYAQGHRQEGDRQYGHRHFAGISPERHHGFASHQYRRPPHAFHGPSRDGHRGGHFASHRHQETSRHGHGRHGDWDRGHRPGEHGFHGYAQRSWQQGPQSRVHVHHGSRDPRRGGEMARHWGPGFHHPGHGRMHMAGFRQDRDGDRSKLDREEAGDQKPSRGKHARKDDHRNDKDGDAKVKDRQDRDGRDAKQDRAKKPSRGDSDPSQSERQDD